MNKYILFLALSLLMASVPGFSQPFLFDLSPQSGIFLKDELVENLTCLKEMGMTPTRRHYAMAVSLGHLEAIRELNRLGGDPVDFASNEPLPTALPVIEALFENTESLPYSVHEKLITYFASQNYEDPPQVVARVWGALIRKGLSANDTPYLWQCNEKCGPMSFAVKHHSEELMEAILVGLGEIEPGPGSNKVTDYLAGIAKYRDWIGGYEVFKVLVRWCTPIEFPELDTKCRHLPEKILERELDRLESAKETPDDQIYADAILVDSSLFLERLVSISGNILNSGLGLVLEKSLLAGNNAFALAVLLEPNKIGKDGYNNYEKAIGFGYLRLAEYLRNLGGKTARTIVIITSNSERTGFMYNAAMQELSNHDILVGTLSPFDVDSSIQLTQSELHPRSILTAKDPAVVAFKNIARIAIEIAHAIWISGGADVWPKFYKSTHAEPPQDILRDLLEFSILEAQENHAYKPVMGVCRGMQIINVFHGGSLQNEGESGVNPIQRVCHRGILGGAFDSDNLEGWSGHQQSVEVMANTLEIVSTTAAGMVKALQSRSDSLPLMGTQFHPEFSDASLEDSRRTAEQVFARFIAMARASQKNTCFPIELHQHKNFCERESIPAAAN